MSRQEFYLGLSLLLLIAGSLTFTAAEASSQEFDNETTPDAREQLIDAITKDYLDLLDYEMSGSKDLLQNVLDDDKFSEVRNELLQGKIVMLQNFIDHIAERRLKKLPPKAHKPARFFHMFGKSLLYKEFVGIVARLERTKSRFDGWIEDALLEYGIETFMERVDEKREKLVMDSARRIDDYVSALSPGQRRKAAAQKLSDWALKMKQNQELSSKMEIFREFLRFEYLETTPPE